MYWDEAFLATTYLINRLPTKVLQLLDVHAGQTYDPSTLLNFSFILNIVPFLAIAIFINASNIL
jgi:hypothetical protein